MNIHVIVNTYNRRQFLEPHLRIISEQAQELGHLISFGIHNDGGEKPHQYPNCTVHNYRNHGKQLYWKLTNTIYKSIPPADIYIQMPDDMRPEADFLKRALKEWAALRKEDPNAICLNLFTDLSRLGRPNWTGVLPEIVSRGNMTFLLSQWVDMCMICGPEFFKAVGTIQRIDPSRWRTDKNLGSGVGMKISHKLKAAGLNMYQTRFSRLQHLGEDSKMNAGHRKKNPLTGAGNLPIVAGLATIKSRAHELRKTVESLLRSCDNVAIVPNDYLPRIPFDDPRVHVIEPDKDRGDTNKFLPIGTLSGDYVYLSCDDDIIYPADYGFKMMKALAQNPRRIVGIHGKTIKPPPVTSFYDRKNRAAMYHCISPLNKPTRVNLLGTGTAAFLPSVFTPKIAAFKNNNMADIYLSMQAHKEGLPLVCLDRPANYLKIQPVKDTIFYRHQNRDQVQTRVYNSFKGWKI